MIQLHLIYVLFCHNLTGCVDIFCLLETSLLQKKSALQLRMKLSNSPYKVTTVSYRVAFCPIAVPKLSLVWPTKTDTSNAMLMPSTPNKNLPQTYFYFSEFIYNKIKQRKNPKSVRNSPALPYYTILHVTICLWCHR